MLHELSADVAARLCALMGVFGITYGAIDLRFTAEGQYVFLEVNPAGVRERIGQPIAAANASSPERHDR